MLSTIVDVCGLNILSTSKFSRVFPVQYKYWYTDSILLVFFTQYSPVPFSINPRKYCVVLIYLVLHPENTTQCIVEIVFASRNTTQGLVYAVSINMNTVYCLVQRVWTNVNTILCIPFSDQHRPSGNTAYIATVIVIVVLRDNAAETQNLLPLTLQYTMDPG